jgi:hypothetical protein
MYQLLWTISIINLFGFKYLFALRIEVEIGFEARKKIEAKSLTAGERPKYSSNTFEGKSIQNLMILW